MSPMLVAKALARPWVDYSQFYVFGTDDYSQLGEDLPEYTASIASGGGKGAAMMVAFRQHGKLPVAVELWDTEPALLSDWGDVAEVPFVAFTTVEIHGWASESVDVIDFLPRGQYRLRYSVSNADQAGETFDEPYPEQYLLQFWEDEFHPARVVSRESAIGRYWESARRAQFARSYPRTTDDPESVTPLIDAALATDPDSLSKIRAGRHEYAVAFLPLLPSRPYDQVLGSRSWRDLVVERALLTSEDS